MINNLKDGRLIVVANAEPYAHEYEEEQILRVPVPGGLTTAVSPLLKEGDIWIGWGRGQADFEVTNGKNIIGIWDKGYYLKRLKLSAKEKEGFYLGFSNRCLWPIFHSFTEKAHFSREFWEIYKKVNRKYVKAVKEELREGDYVWVHDYQLMLVPEDLRRLSERENIKIAFFLHIPWPSWECFRKIPWRKELMEGVLGSEVIGFHIKRYVTNFLECAEELGYKVDKKRRFVLSGQRKIFTLTAPIGIDYDFFHFHRNRRKVKKLRQDIGVENMVISVDRLDYTKGIKERLDAFEHFLAGNPEFLRKVILVQRLAPSRETIPEYEQIKREIDRKISEINGKYQTPEWMPIRHFYESVSQEEIISYYQPAKVALVTPLIDGMNLTAKEYIACQDPEDPGVIILSEAAGAAEQLKDIPLVNPYDVESVAQALKEALTMSLEERKERHKKLLHNVRKENVQWWGEQFLKKWLSLE